MTVKTANARVRLGHRRQVSAAKQQGASPEDALTRLDLSVFSPACEQEVTPSLAAVRRIYEVIDGRAVPQ